jgi:hypothetical protein
MSQLNNVVTTTFRARGGELITQLGSYAQGFGTIGQKINENTRLSERLNSQWRAMGTTIRYAIAGQTIFGLTRMVGQLRDINTQLGEMAALTTAGTGGSAFTGQQVTQLGANLQRVALDTISPLSQVNDAAINFLSTVQNVKPGAALPDMLSTISQTAKIAQTDLTALTQAATTSQVQFGRQTNPKSIGEFTRMWQQLILQAPGGPQASTTIAQALPGLATMFQMGRGSEISPQQGQAQMMGITLAALRTGMPAATAMRGVQYLLQSLENPTGQSVGALRGIGITPEFISQKGIGAALMKFLQQITHTGDPKQLGAIPDDVLDQLDASGGTLPGIPADEMLKLRKYVPRIHGIRAAVVLASQLAAHGDVLSLQQDIDEMLDIQDENSKRAHQMAEAWRRYRKRARLADAANAINVMSLQVAQIFEPVFGFIAEKGILPVAHAMQNHRTATKAGVIGGAAIIAALTTGRFLGGFGKGIAGRSIVRGIAMRDALDGGAGLGASPENPLYVIVVGQLFNDSGKKTSFAKSAIKTAEDDAKQAAKTGGVLGIAAAIVRGVKNAPGMLRRTGNQQLNLLEEEGSRFGGRVLRRPSSIAKRAGALGVMFDYFYDAQNAGGSTENLYADLYKPLLKMYPNMQGYSNVHTGMLNGHAEVFLNLAINQGGKVTHKRVHLPIPMAYQSGRYPSQGGKPGKTAKANG